MSENLDNYDQAILTELQQDASISMDALSERVNLSRNACLSVFVLIRTNQHGPDWLTKFEAAVKSTPEIIGAHRMTGDLDYVLRVRVKDVKSYDNFYQRLIAQVPISDISASFVMEDIVDTTKLPLN